MSNIDDTELVRAVRRGELEDFDELVRRYQGPIYKLAYRTLGNAEDALDATQTTFLKAYDRLDSFDDSKRFFSWLYGIAFRTALDQRERSARHRRSPESGYESRTPDRSPEQEAMGRQSGRRVDSALRELEPSDRALVTLRHLEGLSYTEIAEALSLSVELVRSRLFTARRRLRLLLGDSGEAST